MKTFSYPDLLGVESAVPDLKSSQVAVKGTFTAAELVDYVQKKTGKRTVIVKQDPEPKKDEDNKGKEEKKGGDGDGNGDGGGEKKEEKKSEEGGEKKEETAKPEDAALELRKNEYYYYQPANYQLYPPRYAAEAAYVYPPAPQMFSDENPNACSVM